MNPQERFKAYLAGKGLRLTQERTEVIEAVFDIHDHFTVADLVAHMKKRNLRVGRSTIYRLMPLLVDAQLIREASFCGCNEEQVFEHILGHDHHDHLICDVCGTIVEFEEKAIELLQEKVAEKYGFRLKDHRLDLRGICPDCQKKIIDEAMHPWRSTDARH